MSGAIAGLLGGLAVLIGFGGAYLVARKVADRFPTWPGVVGGFVVGAAASLIVVFAVSSGGAALSGVGGGQAGYYGIKTTLGSALWFALIGGIWGGVRGRKSGLAYRAALAYEASRQSTG